MINLTPDEINEVRMFVKSCDLTDDGVTNEFRKEQLLVLCDMAMLASNASECLHRWEMDGIVTRCAKCKALA